MRQFGTFLSISCSFQRYTFSCVFCTILVSVDRILSLSVWGAPSSLGTKDKAERVGTFGCFSYLIFNHEARGGCLQIVNCLQIASIAAFVANSTEYDLVLLQDLWMRPDHETIRASLPKVTRKFRFLKLKLSSAGPSDDPGGGLGPSSL